MSPHKINSQLQTRTIRKALCLSLLIILFSVSSQSLNAAERTKEKDKPFIYVKELGYQNADYLFTLLQGPETEAPYLATQDESSTNNNGVKTLRRETTQVFYKLQKNIRQTDSENNEETALVCTRKEWRNLQINDIFDQETQTYKPVEKTNGQTNYYCRSIFSHGMRLPGDHDLLILKEGITYSGSN